MPFTRAQQGRYRPLLDDAWKAAARDSGVDPKDKPARESWYRRLLAETVGLTSTVACDAGRDFDIIMARLEEIADTGTYWQHRAETGDFNRICWVVFKKEPRILDGQPVTLAYVCGIAKQALRLPAPPALRTLSKGHLKILTTALAIHRRRRPH